MKGSVRYCAVVFLVFVCTIAGAETIQISVTDSDLEIPLEGVTVQDTAGGTSVQTDVDGNAALAVTVPPSGRIVLQLSLVGYEPVRVLVRDVTEQVTVEMVIAGLVEAQELVIEEEAIGETDEETGISVVAGRELIKTSAMIGILEDVMSTVRILPGVTYSNGFASNLSVRGGEPSGLTHVLDGFVVKYPYHLGGVVSIFNPHLVDSVKLSAGIFSVRYGQATSGLMEITSISPNKGLRWEFATSTSTVEGYMQIPIGKHGGLLYSLRLTNYDLIIALTQPLFDTGGITFARSPYIYAQFIRWLHRPTERTEWFVNVFTGLDGLGVQVKDPEEADKKQKEILFSPKIAWESQSVFASAGLKQLLTKKVLLSALGGYEYVANKVDATIKEYGTQAYSDAFLKRYGGQFNLAKGDTFSIDTRSNFKNVTNQHNSQFRGDIDYHIADNHLMQFGGGTFFTTNAYDAAGVRWAFTTNRETNTREYARQSVATAAPANWQLSNFAYTGIKSQFADNTVEGELGARIDYSTIGGKGYSLQTYPVAGPRLLLRYRPLTKKLDSVTISMGTGIFSSLPQDVTSITREMGLEDFDVKATQSFTTVLGWEARWEQGIRLQIETYYKYLYDRFYNNIVPINTTETGETGMFRTYNDGIGHVSGVDLLLDKRSSLRWDGLLSYSFIVALYKDPQDNAGTNTFGDGPEGTPSRKKKWYYPNFHRFHSLNALVNFKPFTRITITASVSFITGNPALARKEKQMYALPVVNYDGSQTLAELYEREGFFDINTREGWDLPIDLRFAWHTFSQRNPKNRIEWYIGAEDILAPVLPYLGAAAGETEINKFTGEEDADAGQGGPPIPIFSVGFRLSY